MLKTNEVIIQWQRPNKKYFQDKGYFYTGIGNDFKVLVEDLKLGSHALVDVLCDYCKENIVTMQYKTYNFNKSRSVVDKDCCKKCWNIKLKESMLETYNEDNASNVAEFKSKRTNTFITNFGVDNPMKVSEIKNRAIATNVERYGVENLMQIKEIRDSRQIKRMQTMYKNGTVATSKQQRHIHNIIGGELNYPVGNYFLDMAFPEDMIYVEYDGSGHNLDVTIGKVSYIDKQKKEIARYYILKNLGWKMIKIISKNDLLPDDIIIEDVFDECKCLLELNNNCIVDIDNGSIKTKNVEIEYDFGILNKIKTKTNLKEE